MRERSASVVSAWSSGGRRGAASQRIVGVLVQPADTVGIEPLLLHFQVGAYQQIRRQFLNGKSDGFRRLGESPVAHRTVALATARGKQFCRGGVVESIHVLILGYGRYGTLAPRPLPAAKRRRRRPWSSRRLVTCRS